MKILRCHVGHTMIFHRPFPQPSCCVSSLLNHRETWGKSVGTDKILFTPVPVPRNGARVLPFKVVPMPAHSAEIFAWTTRNATFRLVPVPKNRIRV